MKAITFIYLTITLTFNIPKNTTFDAPNFSHEFVASKDMPNENGWLANILSTCDSVSLYVKRSIFIVFFYLIHFNYFFYSF